jgi:hypothetical protein
MYAVYEDFKVHVYCKISHYTETQLKLYGRLAVIHETLVKINNKISQKITKNVRVKGEVHFDIIKRIKDELKVGLEDAEKESKAITNDLKEKIRSLNETATHMKDLVEHDKKMDQEVRGNYQETMATIWGVINGLENDLIKKDQTNEEIRLNYQETIGGIFNILNELERKMDKRTKLAKEERKLRKLLERLSQL